MGVLDGGLSRARLERLREIVAGAVECGDVPGAVALVHRRGETHVVALGAMGFGDDTSGTPMRADTIFRISSMTKPIIAVAAMILVEECRLRLDDPVDDLLPELAGRRVLRRPDGRLEDTVPAERSITVRDLQTFRAGIGMVTAPPGGCPIQRAMEESGLAIGPDGPPCGPDEWMARLGALPLVHQPGTAWMYHTSADVLGVLIARATGRPLGDFLRERVFEPLGMHDTGFHVPSVHLARLAPCYASAPEPVPAGESEAVVRQGEPGAAGEPEAGAHGGESGGPVLREEPQRGSWERAPVFPSGAGAPGLVSTAGDYLTFLRMLLDKGRCAGGGRILSRPAVELMTTDHLTPAQKAGNEVFLDRGGWGFGLAVDARREDLAVGPGRFGWTGGLGTEGYADPAEDLAGVLMTQRALDSPSPPRLFQDFWTAAYAAIDD
ncbi:beta-lactamase family protein [Nonomuraea sp. K274]|uniref:Beta-lactamase family protein n=1 Tax=Nonomuraea cypriaca TaxID=1187855 RepID=A0A931AIV2_9ACTN|nr:serine hydrolase domain-containing protein [Nonomuraea cypriaca]MBF8189917.1 beta-lactamase family protein [Nonomuraea cypriaca]